jgi:hypothetical protein
LEFKLIFGKVADYTRGWFIGNFEPSLFRMQEFETCYKSFSAGDKEPPAVQVRATELTLVVHGEALINGVVLKDGDLCVVLPGESADFFALTDCKVVGIKFPSIADDKKDL